MFTTIACLRESATFSDSGLLQTRTGPTHVWAFTMKVAEMLLVSSSCLSSCLSACYSSKTVLRVFMKLGSVEFNQVLLTDFSFVKIGQL
jgi:hypothetical protein